MWGCCYKWLDAQLDPSDREDAVMNRVELCFHHLRVSPDQIRNASRMLSHRTRLIACLISVSCWFQHATAFASPAITAFNATLNSESCSPANQAIDPGETVTVNLGLKNVGTTDTVSLVATLQATGGVIAPSGPQTYGLLVAGGAPVTKSFSFRASGICGGTLTAAVQLQDGASDLGMVTFVFVLGKLIPTTTSFANAAFITIPHHGPATPILPPSTSPACPAPLAKSPSP